MSPKNAAVLIGRYVVGAVALAWAKVTGKEPSA